MKGQDHPPAYALQFKRQWRIMVPIRGKLTPKICPAEFPSRGSAEAWLRSDEGKLMVDSYQGRLALAPINSVAVAPPSAFYASNPKPP
jgi:hypothetical protein